MRWLGSVLALLCLASGCTRREATGLNPGDLAPPIDLKTTDGQALKLSDFRGKVVLLNFFSAWCGPCKLEAPDLERLNTRFKDQGFAVVGVGMDDTLEHFMEFKREFGLTFPIFFDPDASLRNDYKVSGFPESFFLDRGGHIVMVPDIGSDEPVVKIVGPREWSSEQTASLIQALLKK
ncbi:MAG: TlpA family protein disulfide reductase [Oligoflexia bacterium]|nr:TlpA family protein disulfide reductase [Oligoflexia bacterium]